MRLYRKLIFPSATLTLLFAVSNVHADALDDCVYAAIDQHAVNLTIYSGPVADNKLTNDLYDCLTAAGIILEGLDIQIAPQIAQWMTGINITWSHQTP